MTTDELCALVCTMHNIHIITHPIVQDRLTRLRDKGAEAQLFRQCLNDIAMILAVEATQHLPTKAVTVQTPLAQCDGVELVGKPLIVPILRAGLALSDTLNCLLPHADTGHIGLARDHDTHEPHIYLNKLPSDLKRPIFVCDPMLATAGSMIATLDILVQQGAKTDNVTLITLVCAPEGIDKLREKYPDVPVYTAAIDDCLNGDAYIVPGLGDAGDRYFGTE